MNWSIFLRHDKAPQAGPYHKISHCGADYGLRPGDIEPTEIHIDEAVVDVEGDFDCFLRKTESLCDGVLDVNTDAFVCGIGAIFM